MKGLEAGAKAGGTGSATEGKAESAAGTGTETERGIGSTAGEIAMRENTANAVDPGQETGDAGTRPATIFTKQGQPVTM